MSTMRWKLGAPIACGALLLAPSLALACRTTARARAYPRAAVQPDATQQGIALYQQGRYAEAEAMLSSASGADANAYRAASLVELRRFADAEAPARAALRDRPTHPVAAAALGEALVTQHKYDDAVAGMSAVIDAYAGRDDRAQAAYAFYWRGQAYYAKRETAHMVDDMQVFLELAPNAPEATTVRQLLAGLR